LRHGLPLRISEHVINFPSFSEGLSLRLDDETRGGHHRADFPSFLEGLSLRPTRSVGRSVSRSFPFLLGRAFIEAKSAETHSGSSRPISLLFRRDFH